MKNKRCPSGNDRENDCGRAVCSAAVSRGGTYPPTATIPKTAPDMPASHHPSIRLAPASTTGTAAPGTTAPVLRNTSAVRRSGRVTALHGAGRFIGVTRGRTNRLRGPHRPPTTTRVSYSSQQAVRIPHAPPPHARAVAHPTPNPHAPVPTPHSASHHAPPVSSASASSGVTQTMDRTAIHAID
jgi:hypothetical protein